jgi:hypothetical protein
LCVILVLVTLFFAAIALFGILGKANNPQILQLLDLDLVRALSLIMLPLSCTIGYVISVADSVRFSPNMPEIKERQFRKLEEEFEKLGGAA